MHRIRKRLIRAQRNWNDGLSGPAPHGWRKTFEGVDSPPSKAVRSQLSYLDVLQAARDGQKTFEAFTTTRKLPVSR